MAPRYTFTVPIDAQIITPNEFMDKSTDEINALHIWEGNTRQTIGDLFKVEYRDSGSKEEMTIQIQGHLTKLKKIGTKMSCGRMQLVGNVGVRLGEGMRGGEIFVKGNADAWAGRMMKRGRIEITGSAGDYLGAAYRGSTEGMKGGSITVHGNAGSEVGCFMKDGLITIHGNIGLYGGIHMRNGTILVKGNSEERVGAQMIGGKIIILGKLSSVLPSFNIDSIKGSVKVGTERISGPFYMFRGDLTEYGEGRLYIHQTQNTHLKRYDKYLVMERP